MAAGRPTSSAAVTPLPATRGASRCAPAAPELSSMAPALNSLSLASLSARERRMVIPAAVLAVLLLIFGILVPLDRSVAHAQARLAKKKADLTWMQGAAPAVFPLRAAPGG